VSFETLKKMQLALLSSNFVLTAALRDPSIASLSALSGLKKEPVEWLQENLAVDFPQNGEILRISLSGDALKEELEMIVDAVAKAYMKEVVNERRQRRLATRDLLARNLENLNTEIKRKFEDFLDVARLSGHPQAGIVDAETKMLLDDISTMQRKKDDLTSRLYEAQTDFMIIKGELDDPSLIEQQIDEFIAKDPQMARMQEQISFLQLSQAGTSSRAKSGSSKATQVDREIEALNRQMEQYRLQTKQKLLHEIQTKPNVALQQLTKRYKTMFGSLQGQMAAVTKALDIKLASLKTRIERSSDLETKEDDLEQLQHIANDMSVKLESLDIDASAPDQIRPVQPAVGKKNINRVQHYSIAVLGGLAGFVLTCLGIAYLEFRNRRLNGPEEMDEGLGIRVVGTLPGLSSRKALDPNHPIVAQLTESIDGVRTILMHDSTSKRRQVVLVTSAATLEGRTTVASQLAASLARAGRRTLLVDGDLRSPSLHALFDAPLEDGLC